MAPLNGNPILPAPLEGPLGGLHPSQPHNILIASLGAFPRPVRRPVPLCPLEEGLPGP